MTRTVAGPFTRAGRPVFVAEAVRTPIGKSHPERGWFRNVHPNAMLAACYTDLISRTGMNPAAVEDLVIGCTAPFGEQSRNIGRNAWLQAGYPPEVPAQSVRLAAGKHTLEVTGGPSGDVLRTFEPLQDCFRYDDQTIPEAGLKSDIQDRKSVV